MDRLSFHWTLHHYSGITPYPVIACISVRRVRDSVVLGRSSLLPPRHRSLCSLRPPLGTVRCQCTILKQACDSQTQSSCLGGKHKSADLGHNVLYLLAVKLSNLCSTFYLMSACPDRSFARSHFTKHSFLDCHSPPFATQTPLYLTTRPPWPLTCPQVGGRGEVGITSYLIRDRMADFL